MITKKKTALKLYLLLSVMSVFILLIGSFGISGMKTMNENTETLHADRIIPLQQLNQIHFSYESGIRTIAEEVENNLISRRKAKGKIEDAEAEIQQNWSAYLKSYLTPEERQLVEETKVVKANADQAILNLKQKLESPSVAIYQDSLLGIINPFIAKINALTQLQIRVSNDVHQSNELLYRASEKNLILLILAAVLFAGILGFFIIGDTRRFIDHLKISRQKIKEAEQKCRTFIRYAGDSIFILDLELHILEVNDSALKLLGYEAEELLRMKISDVMSPEEQKELLVKLDLINKLGGSIHERKFLRKDNQIVDTEVNVRVLEGIGYISIIRDITERKKTQMEMKDSEEKYRYLFQNSPACNIIWDLETLNVLEVNEVVINKYGYSKEEWASMTVLDIRPEEDHEQILNFAKLMREGKNPIVRRNWKHLKKNGEVMSMEISSHKIIYHGKNAILSLANDVSEQLKAEDSLRKSEEIFRSLVDHAPDAIFMVNDSGIIFDVNHSATELFHYTKEKLIGMTVLDLHPEEEREHMPKIWDSLRKNKSYTDERKLQRSDGKLIEVEISRQMLPDASGAIAIVRDITERKQAEEKIKQSEANYRQLFEHSPAPMWVLDNKTYRFVQVNNASINNYGYSREEFSQLSIDAILPKDDEISAIKGKSKRDLFLMGGHHHVTKSGELIDVETSSIPVVLNGEKRILVIAIDVTKKKLYEQKLTRETIKAQDEERYEIGRELHDNICQILVSSLIFFEMMKKTVSPEGEGFYVQTQEHIDLAFQEIRKLSHRLAPAFFDNTTFEDAIRNLLINFNAAKKHKIIFDFQNETESHPLSLELQLNLYRIIQEQLRNISKHAQATKINLKIEISRDSVRMNITDNGVGFDPKAGKGGIGLANMNRRMQLFSGKLNLISSPGKGCSVKLEVPLSSAN